MSRIINVKRKYDYIYSPLIQQQRTKNITAETTTSKEKKRKSDKGKRGRPDKNGAEGMR